MIFGAKGGLVTFNFHEGQIMDEKDDRMAFAFKTSQEDAVVVRISSSKSSDYFQVEIMDGKVLAVYNMGFVDHVVGDFSRKVNDNLYHVIKIYRSSLNVSMQIDDWSPVFKTPSGRQIGVFNQVSQIMIGGKRESKGQVNRGFVGGVRGLWYDGVNVGELMSRGDWRVKIEGDVTMTVRNEKNSQADLSKE
ncbi:hypothetical protein HELRODRAFT_76021 [Helobdella robusta]|uniref:Laminin G domain-containing protein n=1 Tax=Helobdella robusta TaxID=6412 RepID=T1G2E1_HELRO|nr:hypothetical protein HELRODRAFT_76021 [Helobdella robusta]ESO07562.1 hypothetical protein HELRODRAFT_76021 [Helobdella robusta]